MVFVFLAMMMCFVFGNGREGFSFPPQGDTSISDITDGPSKRFVSDEEEDEKRKVLAQKFSQGDVVLLATLQEITARSVGAGNISVPLVRITLDNILLLKGELPKSLTFNYVKSPTLLEAREGERALVVLKRSRTVTEGFNIIWVLAAGRRNLSLTRHILNVAIPNEMETKKIGRITDETKNPL